MKPIIDVSNIGQSIEVFSIDTMESVAEFRDMTVHLSSLHSMVKAPYLDISPMFICGKKFWSVTAGGSTQAKRGRISAIDKDGNPLRYGSIIVIGYEKNDKGVGRMRSLTKDEKALIMDNLGIIGANEGGAMYDTYCLYTVTDKPSATD